MKNNRLLGIVSSSIFSILASSAAFAANMTGNVLSIDPIEARQSDGTVKTYNLTSQQFNRWEDRGTITLFSGAESGCKCMAPSLGILEKPISLRVESQGVRYTLTIPAHRTVLFNNQGSIQIDIKDSELGSIGVDQAGSTAQHDAIITDYENLRKSTAALLEKLSDDIASEKLQQAREDYSKVVANELYSSDVSQLDQLIKSMPVNERPINTYTGDVRWEMRSMVKTFGGVNFDQMTLKEFVAFINKWASTTAVKKNEGDQTYLFRFMDQVGIPENVQEKLLIKTIETRLAKFVELAKKGADPRKDIIWDDEYSFEGAMKHLIYGKSESGKAYVQDLKKRVSNMDASTQAFLRDIFMLNDLFRN